MSEQEAAAATQAERRYMSVEIYHPFEDFFQDPNDAEGIVRRRWRKYAGDDIDEDELWDRYRGLSDSYRTKPELDRSEDESEEAITASIKDPTRFSDDKKRNLLMVTLFLNRRIPEYLKENGDIVFTATSSGAVFQSLSRELCQEEPKLRGTTSKDLVIVYTRVVEMAETLSRILETDTDTGWRESFRKTIFSEAAEKLANLDRGFRGKRRTLRLEYIGPEPADVIALQEEEARERLPRTRGRDRRNMGNGTGDRPSNATLTAVVIPTTLAAKKEKKRATRTRKRKRAVKSSGSTLTEVKKAARQGALHRPQSAAVDLPSPSLRQHHHQPAQQVELQPAIFDKGGDEGECYDVDIDDTVAYNSRDQRPTSLPHGDNPRTYNSGPLSMSTASNSRHIDPHRQRGTLVQTAGWSHGRDDRGSQSTAPSVPVRFANTYSQGPRRTTKSGLPRFSRLQSIMLAFREDMDTQMGELTEVLRHQKAQLDEFHKSAEDILIRLSDQY
ncbi:hypothetical protein BG015_000867 [Linnemannia schmuckeri]|uniref:Uncharacterized protein n=1 Tax=Linnemannia schmuckeri TaxID=64567 RepID=A0A9P5S6H7_9FUNG|nr:hypothetical protein BG015_000867 [Linnemannia schmuckeri]